MSDEPSNAELAWRLQQIRDDLRQVVGHPEYAADKLGTDRRFSELEQDVTDIRRDLAAHQRDHRESSLSWRSILYTAVPATVVALMAILAQLWVSKG